jgi:hypothetical protein
MRKKSNPRRQPIQKKAAPKLKALNPIQTKRALDAVSKLYEDGDCAIFTYEWREDQVRQIMKCSKLWGQG